MSKENLNPIQKEIYDAVHQMAEKASFTEFQLAKKIRENKKIDGKKKAGISLSDLLNVMECLESEEIYYSVHINSVNEILCRKEIVKSELPLEAKQRRQKSEKSMSILTSGDFDDKKSVKEKSGKNHKKRSERKKMSIYGDYE